MKKLIILSMLSFVTYANACVNVGSNGEYTVDSYGDSWQKSPTKDQVDPKPKAFLDLFDMTMKK